MRIASAASETNLLFLNPRHDPSQEQGGRNKNGPQPDMQDGLIVARLGRSSDGGQSQNQHGVSGHAMILVHLLGLVDAAKDTWGIELQNADQGLDVEKDVRNEAQHGMHALKVWYAVVELVVLDDDQARYEGADTGSVESSMYVGALALLLRRVCRL